jgi:hypothetical protein
MSKNKVLCASCLDPNIKTTPISIRKLNQSGLHKSTGDFQQYRAHSGLEAIQKGQQGALKIIPC